MSETSINMTSDSEKGRNDVKKTNPHLSDESPIAGETGDEFREDAERAIAAAGEHKFNRLGWKRLTIVLIVEAIALGSLSLPSAFATLGMVAGTICSVGLGLLAIYTSDLVGMVKIKFPEVAHYADAARLVAGTFGYELVGAMFALQLVLLIGSHCLTGAIALLNISDNIICSVGFAAVSAVVLWALALPPSFTELAILGYIDFASIIIAIGITMIATGIKAAHAEGGLAAVPWSAWPKEDLTFVEAFIAITNIVFAYSFSICQFSFMDEMHTPKDYKKSIWALGLIEIAIYTITGAVIYAFVGPEVKSPALLSAGPLVSKIAFGIGLPVIFISGSINGTVVGRFIFSRVFKNSIIRYINTKKAYAIWAALLAVLTIIAWVIAEAIPFFSDLLSISSSLFISGFTYYFPAIFWFVLLKEGSIFDRKNLVHLILSSISMIVGLIVLVAGTYASAVDIKNQYRNGTVRGPFTCAPLA
ncbi:transmembrane amino acid transporter domain-containing protein [Trichoderma barbatum]